MIPRYYHKGLQGLVESMHDGGPGNRFDWLFTPLTLKAHAKWERYFVILKW